MDQYYIAEKSCMMSVQSRLMLIVSENREVQIFAGETNARFGFDEEGRLTQLNWDGMSLPYGFRGPIPEDQAKKLRSDDAHNGYEHDFDRFPRRIRSIRRIT